MTAADVVELHTKVRDQGIEMWIDGGWGVDALLGEQTRPHQDLDDTGWAYPADSLAGSRTIDGHAVRCIAAAYIVKFRTGYKLRECDYRMSRHFATALELTTRKSTRT